MKELIWPIIGGLIAIASAILIALTVPIANAQPAISSVCNEREYVINLLAHQYAERPFAIGLSSKGYIVELFLSHEGRTWTLVSTQTNGVSCFLDAGEYWTIEKKFLTDEKIKTFQ